MTEKHALALLKKKDPAALSYFIDCYTPYVSTVIWNVISRRMSVGDAEEICSDVFMALWLARQTPQPGKVKAYLGSIARNKAIDRLRRQGFDVELEGDVIGAAENDPELILERREQQLLVRRAVESMGQPDQDIFIRYYYYCQTGDRIAQELAMTPSSVRQRLKRGREKLRKILIEGGIQDEISNF